MRFYAGRGAWQPSEEARASHRPLSFYLQSIDPSTGEVNVLWVSNDPHIRCLALAPDGTLYAGTAGSGLVARIEEGGRAFVLTRWSIKLATGRM